MNQGKRYETVNWGFTPDGIVYAKIKRPGSEKLRQIYYLGYDLIEDKNAPDWKMEALRNAYRLAGGWDFDPQAVSEHYQKRLWTEHIDEAYRALGTRPERPGLVHQNEEAGIKPPERFWEVSGEEFSEKADLSAVGGRVFRNGTLALDAYPSTSFDNAKTELLTTTHKYPFVDPDERILRLRTLVKKFRWGFEVEKESRDFVKNNYEAMDRKEKILHGGEEEAFLSPEDFEKYAFWILEDMDIDAPKIEDSYSLSYELDADGVQRYLDATPEERESMRESWIEEAERNYQIYADKGEEYGDILDIAKDKLKLSFPLSKEYPAAFEERFEEIEERLLDYLEYNYSPRIDPDDFTVEAESPVDLYGLAITPRPTLKDVPPGEDAYLSEYDILDEDREHLDMNKKAARDLLILVGALNGVEDPRSLPERFEEWLKERKSREGPITVLGGPYSLKTDAKFSKEEMPPREKEMDRFFQSVDDAASSSSGFTEVQVLFGGSLDDALAIRDGKADLVIDPSRENEPCPRIVLFDRIDGSGDLIEVPPMGKVELKTKNGKVEVPGFGSVDCEVRHADAKVGGYSVNTVFDFYKPYFLNDDAAKVQPKEERPKEKGAAPARSKRNDLRR